MAREPGLKKAHCAGKIFVGIRHHGYGRTWPRLNVFWAMLRDGTTYTPGPIWSARVSA